MWNKYNKFIKLLKLIRSVKEKMIEKLLEAVMENY